MVKALLWALAIASVFITGSLVTVVAYGAFDPFTAMGAVPATFWGVVAGSFFSLGGVFLSNRSSEKRLQTQLGHDREIKRQDLELSTRKEIYLDAVEAVAVSINIINQCTDLDISHESLGQQSRTTSGAMAKVHLVATETTLRHFTTFSNELGAAYLRIMGTRIPLTAEKSNLDILRKQMDQLGLEGESLVELMKQHNLAGSPDQAHFASIQRQFDFSQGRHQKSIEEFGVARRALYTKVMDFSMACVDEVTRLRVLATPALIAAREELGLPLELSKYQSILQDSAASMRPALDEFVEQAKRHIRS